MSIYADIRSALEQAVVGVVGFPPADQRAWENVNFDPTDGTPWARMTLIPTSRRPATLGANLKYLYNGIFMINLFYPEGDGPGAVEALADTLVSTFDVKTTFTENTVNVRILHSDRKQGSEQSPWYMVPVMVHWYTYHA